MDKIAVTGNIASGKTAASSILRRWGFPVFDADQASHGFLANPAVTDYFAGEDVFDDQGQICRKKLGKVVFSDAAKRKALEGIIHPLVKQAMNEFFDQHQADEIVFAEIPLLYEAGFEGEFDAVLLVVADLETRIGRLMARNGLNRQEAESRIAAQMPQEEKIAKATHIVRNTGDLANLENQVIIITKKYGGG